MVSTGTLVWSLLLNDHLSRVRVRLTVLGKFERKKSENDIGF